MEECLKTRQCRGCMTDWRRGWEFFLPPLFPTFQCTPSYSSTIVHIAWSLLPTHPHFLHVALGESFCIRADAHSTHILKQCLRHDLQFVSSFGKVPELLQATPVTHTVIKSAKGVFYSEGFYFLWERPPPRHLAHIWSSLMRGSVCLTLYCEPIINLLHSRVVKILQPSSLSLAKAKWCRYMNDNGL